MKSFDENLESLEIAPRFLDHTTLVQLRRDSSTNRCKKDSSCIFLEKRERLESGDFASLSNVAMAKREFAATFQQHGPQERTEVWNNANISVPEPQLNAHVNGLAGHNGLETKANEEESVIDHCLTIEKTQKPALSVTEPPAESVTKDDSAKDEPKFLIKVRKTDTRITVSVPDSDNCAIDEVSEMEEVPEEAPEERGNNLIFADEPSRLRAKMTKVAQYWKNVSLLIPNVFRALRPMEEDQESYLELQDYSRKELLVQSNGLKFKGSADREKNKGIKKVKKTSSAQVLKSNGFRV